MTRYRRRPTPTQRVDDGALRDYITSLLMARKDRREAISFLIQTVRESGGLYLPTRLNDAESVLERCGFRLARDYNECGSILRTYVEMPNV